MRGCSRPTSSARVSLAPAPGSGQLSHTHFIFRMPRALVILSSPWWTPGLPHARSALCPRTEAPSCHPPAAQLLLKDVLQRAGILCFHPRLKNTWLQTQIEGKEGAKASCNQAPTIFGGGPSKIIADINCSHEIKRHLLLGRKAMTNLDSILKSRDINFLTKVHLLKAMVFPVVINGCESWTIKKAKHRRIDPFKL